MFQSKIDELRNGVKAAVRASCVAAGAAVMALVALSFLWAAAFVSILDRYGLIQACLASAGVFLVASLVLVSWYFALVRRRRQPKEAAKSMAQAALTDPMMIAAGIQIVRAIGVKRMIPLLAIGGIALGLLVKSSSPRKSAPD
jgi:hypothetical protein